MNSPDDKEHLNEEQIQLLDEAEVENDKTYISNRIKEELRNLNETLNACEKKNVPIKKKVWYDGTLASRLVQTLRDLISHKYSNWERGRVRVEGEEETRNTLIFKALRVLTDTKNPDDIPAVMNGLGHASSVPFTAPNIWLAPIFKILYSIAKIPADKLIELKTVLTTKDKELLKTLKKLHLELETQCSKSTDGGKRRKKRISSTKKKSKKSRKNRKKSKRTSRR
jgi:hypothetical protein